MISARNALLITPDTGQQSVPLEGSDTQQQHLERLRRRS